MAAAAAVAGELNDPTAADSGGASNNNSSANNSEQNRKLFLGGLSYSTTEDGLRDHFGQFGELVDVVVMRFPDTKRSRGFGFVTFATEQQADSCYEARPHDVDNTQVETKRATPREEMRPQRGGDGDGGPSGSGLNEAQRKLFIGGLSYSTTDDGLRSYFEKYGEIVDCVVMKFRDTKRSRGFGFVTYSDTSMVDAVQNERPHTVEGSKVETKRATPREDLGKGESSQPVRKIFLGGIKDGMENEDIKEYFEQFGTVTHVEHMTDKQSGRKRGFGFVEFDDYDSVDKVVLQPRHQIKSWKVDVKKAISKNEMNQMRDDHGGGRGGRDRGDRDHHRRGGGGGRRDHHGGGGGGGGGPAPWGNQGGGYGDRGGYGGGYGGGGGGGYGQQGGGGYGGGGPFGGDGGGGGGYGGWGDNNAGGGGGGQPNPWQGGGNMGGGGGGMSSWDNQGAQGGWGQPQQQQQQGGWGQQGGGGGGGAGMYDNYGRQGAGGQGQMGMGGPMRNQMGGGARSAPYNTQGRQGYSTGGQGGSFMSGGGGGGGVGGRGGGNRW